MSSNQISTFVFRASLLLSVFIIGGVFAIKEYPPFSLLLKGYDDASALAKEIYQTRSTILEKYVYEGDGVTKNDSVQSYKGLTLLQGIFPGGLQVKLIDMDGTLLNTWELDFFKIWPDPSHLTEQKQPKSYFDHHSQGILALKDGSIIVNFGYLGTAKLDKCGEVIWTVDRMTRHFVTPTSDGNYWIGANREIDDISEELLFFGIKRSWLKHTYQRYENTMLLVSPEGEVLKEVSLLQGFYDAGQEGHIFDALKIAQDDPTHHNNIEEVTQALADKIDDVNKGDWLVSMRNMNMLNILDKDTFTIKWSYSGAWTRQHDPDITPEGNIVVFNNSRRSYGFNRVQGSSLTELDPATMKTRIIHPRKGQPGFYTRIFGTHQTLPNGNIFISEGLAGRAFEINNQGDIVWEFISRYDDEYASVVEEAYRLDYGFFNVENWECSSTLTQ
ncbi:MAG: arylsulfotransferase family protein [Pseudomonadales bacterium]|nr:arylsulfotransferase family protein [Pseudomonadales bacterium]